jgi:hypothetical protein
VPKARLNFIREPKPTPHSVLVLKTTRSKVDDKDAFRRQNDKQEANHFPKEVHNIRAVAPIGMRRRAHRTSIP